MSAFALYQLFICTVLYLHIPVQGGFAGGSLPRFHCVCFWVDVINVFILLIHQCNQFLLFFFGVPASRSSSIAGLGAFITWLPCKPLGTPRSRGMVCNCVTKGSPLTIYSQPPLCMEQTQLNIMPYIPPARHYDVYLCQMLGSGWVKGDLSAEYAALYYSCRYILL